MAAGVLVRGTENMNDNAKLQIKPVVLVREQAFEKLRDAIITGQFAPGKRLIERELCEAMGISRTSVREALRRLEAERLAKTVPRIGLIVAELNRKETMEIYEIRGQLEVILFKRFTEIATDEEVEKLCEINDVLREAPIFLEDPEMQKNNIIFRVNQMNRLLGHVMDVVGHEVIRSFLDQLIARVSVLRAKSISQPGRLDDSARELDALIEAVISRQPEVVEEKLKIYMNNARDAALNMIGK